MNPHFTITTSIYVNCKIDLAGAYIMTPLHAPKSYESYLDFDVEIARKVQAVYFVR